MSKMIVVGIDGSEASVRALEVAIEEARLRGAELKAVSAWHIPASAYEAWVPTAIDPAEFEKLAHETLEKSLAAAGAADSGVSVTPLPREGQAADVLIAEAREADLLVVGSRGLGGFKGLLLGSVSQQCAQHASCPVMIVPNSNRPA